MKQSKNIEMSKVIESNYIQFERYDTVERVQNKESKKNEENATIGALTNFEMRKESKQVELDTSVETKESLTPEEIERRRVAEFKKKYKDEIDSLKIELQELQGMVIDNPRSGESDQR